MLPDFLVVGAQRAGTTSLRTLLRLHPGAALPAAKEVHHFDHAPLKGLAAYRAHFPLRTTVARCGQALGRPLAVGEVSPYYLFHPLVPERVHAAIPQARIVCLLRNPTDRALSHFRLEHRHGAETEQDFRRAWSLEKDRLHGAEEALAAPGGQHFGHVHFSYTARGDYAPQVARWFERFGRERVHVVLSEQLFHGGGDALTGLLDFLGLDPLAAAPFPHANPTRSSGEEAGLRAELDAHFLPRIEALEELLGRRTGWIS